MASSPTSRTNELLRKLGYKTFIAERWNSFAKLRQDAFGFGDILAVKSSEAGSILVQCTSDSNHAARRTKIEENEVAKVWLTACNQIIVISWKKRMQGKIGRWTFRAEKLNTYGIWSPIWENLEIAGTNRKVQPPVQEVMF
jgi:hypothetical protein